MDTVFTAHTSHGTILAVDVVERRAHHVASSELNQRVVPLRLLTGGVLRTRCLPFGVEPVQLRPFLPLEISPGAGIVLHALQEDEPGALRSAVSNRYVSAIPGGGLEGNRVAAAAWEQFHLVPDVNFDPHASPAIEQFVSRARTSLATSVPWLYSLTTLLNDSASELTAGFVEAVWPLLTLDEFDRLARQLRTDKTLSSRLPGLFPSDFYAITALPALLEWMEARERQPDPAAAHSSGTSSAMRRSTWSTPWSLQTARHEHATAAAHSGRLPPRLIGPEADHLARDGYDGHLSSFAHAFNASLRNYIVPTKGTAIVATARSEGVYLLEWIAHHRLLGVEAIFLYTNNNDDGSDALLAALHAAGAITWTRSEPASGISAQNKAYGHALNVNLALLEYRWALFIDLDEFLVLNPARYRSITDFARFHEMRQTDAVGINWVMVGSTGQLRWTEAPLTRRNTHLLGEPNAHIKTMMAPQRFIQAHPHFPFAERRRAFTFRLANGDVHEHRNRPKDMYHAQAFTDEPSEDHASLYHYYFKSLEEFIWKYSRNRGDLPMSYGINFQYLDEGAVSAFVDQHRTSNIRESKDSLGRSKRVDEEIERLRSLPHVRDSEEKLIRQFGSRLADVKAQLLQSGRLHALGGPGVELERMLNE